MAGAITLLKYQMLGHWRRSFAVRGKYDRSSLFLVLMILAGGYGYVLLLRQMARSLLAGNTGDLKWLLGIVFFVWLLPAFAGVRASANLEAFLFLPLTRARLALISLAGVFLVPMSAVAAVVSAAAIYPFLFSGHVAPGALTLFVYSLFAAFSLTLLVRLLRLRAFRIGLFLLAVMGAVSFFGPEWLRPDLGLRQGSLPHYLVIRVVSGDGPLSALLVLTVFAVASFLLAVFTLGGTVASLSGSNRRLAPSWLARLRLPIRYGELVKKDFLVGWTMLDGYISLFVCLVYAFILIMTDLSFLSFGPAISFAVMMSAGLAFSVFGLETTQSFQRLSLAPIAPAELFTAKHRALALLTISQTFFLFPIILIKFGPVYLMAAMAKTVAISMLYMAWGNYLSVKFPFKLYPYEVSFGGSLPDMIGAVFVISLLAIVPDLLLRENVAFILLGNAGFAALGHLVYTFSLRRFSQRLPAEWENIALKLT
jgi:hypothetical protein